MKRRLETSLRAVCVLGLLANFACSSDGEAGSQSEGDTLADMTSQKDVSGNSEEEDPWVSRWPDARTSDSASYAPCDGTSGSWEYEYSDSYALPEPDLGSTEPPNTELYGQYIENEFVATATQSTSTFSVDVDTASYSNARRFLNSGTLPPPDSIRVEEFVNYFSYDYPQPELDPFSVNMEVAPSPFGEGLHMLRIGIQGKIIPEEERIPANLVFLIDVSGSMQSDNKLPLVKFLLSKLVTVLRSDDRLGIVVYASQQGTLLPSTPVEEKSAILDAIDGLEAGGSTAGAAGLKAAYEMVSANMVDGGINRVVLCTDGDFNVGVTGEALITMIEAYRESGVTLSVFGFGTGNYKDMYMEQLADHGNGNYAYIDSQNEALHIISEKLVSTLQVIAKDVKVQVEFNPANILRYRLVGYENRLLENDDFNDDTVDAAEVGAGHTVTAFYEVELAQELSAERLAECRFRYKEPQGTESILISQTVMPESVVATVEETSPGFRLAAAVVEFAEILRHSKHCQDADFEKVLELAQASADEQRPIEAELLQLIEAAKSLWIQE